MILKVFDKNFVFLGFGDDSVKINQSIFFSEMGTLEAEVPLTKRNLEMYNTDGYIMTDERTYVIEFVSVDSENSLIYVSSRDLLVYLKRSVIDHRFAYSGEVCPLILSLASMAYPSVFPLDYEVSEESFDSDEIEYFVEYRCLYDVIKELCVSYGIGMKINLDIPNRKFVFNIMRYRERGKSDQSPIIISEQFENCSSGKYTLDLSDYYNKTLIFGAEKTGGQRHIANLSASDCMFGDNFDDSLYSDRYIFTGGSSVKAESYYKNIENDSALDESKYFAALRELGRKKLAAHRPKKMFECTVVPDIALSLYPGDICTLRSDRFGIFSAAAVTEKKISEEKGNLMCTVKLKLIENSESA